MIPASRVCILLPTLNRPDLLRRALENIRQTAPGVTVVVATDPDDPHSRERAKKYGCIVVICDGNRLGCHHAWNKALAAAPDNMLVFVLGADDSIYLPDWLEYALKTLDEMGDSGVVGFTGINERPNPYRATHYMMTRDFIIDYMGGVFVPPIYRNDYSDWHTCAVAVRAGKFRKSAGARIRHYWGGPDGDDTYAIASKYRQASYEKFLEQEQLGFPITWEPIITK
jgi:GT2 family glycosyltransferase